LPDSQLTAAHNPALLHHFAEPQQQRDAASLGMWVFLGTEIMFFGGLFCTYLVYRRWYFGDWGAASKTLDVTLGATNTAVLICSSLTVVLAVWAAQTSRRKLLIGNLLATLVLGTAFLGIKAIEYKEKFEKHHSTTLPFPDIPTSTPIRAMRRSSLLSTSL
jgi:cytochrome c oxidase subunit 3